LCVVESQDVRRGGFGRAKRKKGKTTYYTYYTDFSGCPAVAMGLPAAAADTDTYAATATRRPPETTTPIGPVR
jgi:hypothetical protein